MANIFSALAVPAGVGVGANTNVSAMGRTKTITVSGAFSGSLTLEAASDAAGAVFVPIKTITEPARDFTVDIACRFMRIRRTGILPITGTPIVNVASDDAGAQLVALPAPAADGVGATTNVALLGTFNTIIVGTPAYGGVVTIEISADAGTTWAQLISFGPGGGHWSGRIVAQSMRVRRVDASLGTPTVVVAAINDPVTSASGEPGRYAIPEKWVQLNIAEVQVDIPLSQQVSTIFANDTKMIRAGSLTGLSTRINTAILTSILGIVVTINGANTTLMLLHTNASNPTGGEAVIASGVEAFAAGDLIGVTITTSEGFTPLTADIECWIEIDTD